MNDETEQFVVFPPAQTASSLASGTVLLPGSMAILKSVQTGKFCRVVEVGTLRQVACDLSSPANATALTFTGTTFTFGGMPLTNPYGNNVSFLGKHNIVKALPHLLARLANSWPFCACSGPEFLFLPSQRRQRLV
jgi:hypothetical protein